MKPKSVPPIPVSADAVVQSCRRCAEFLGVLCVISIAAIWILNSKIRSNAIANAYAYQEFSNTGQMLARLRAYEARGPDYYLAVAYSCVSHIPYGGDYQTLRQGSLRATFSSTDGSYSGSSLSPNPTSNEFYKTTERFTAQATLIMASKTDSADREKRLLIMVDDLTKDLEVRSVFQKEIIPTILKLDTAPWREVLRWVIGGEPHFGLPYPEPGPPFARIAYEGRLEAGDDPRELLLLAEADNAGSAYVARAVFYSAWTKAYERLLSISHAEPQIGIIGTGMTVAAGDLMVIVAPGLIAFQLLFLVLWEARTRRIALHEPLQQPFDFPSFASPRDPLKTPRPSGIAEWAMRAAWAVFVIMPVLIILVGVVARYDFRSFEPHHSSWDVWDPYARTPFIPPLNLELWDDRGISVALDYFHLGLWGLSFVVLLQLTRDPEQVRRSWQWYGRAGVIFAIVATAYLWRWKAIQYDPSLDPVQEGMGRVTRESSFSSSMFKLYVPAVSLVLLGAIVVALRDRSRLGFVLGMVVFAGWCFLTLR